MTVTRVDKDFDTLTLTLVAEFDAPGARAVFEHSLKLEDARAYATYGQNSYVGKILEVRQEFPDRIHVVLIRQSVGF